MICKKNSFKLPMENSKKFSTLRNFGTFIIYSKIENKKIKF